MPTWRRPRLRVPAFSFQLEPALLLWCGRFFGVRHSHAMWTDTAHWIAEISLCVAGKCSGTRLQAHSRVARLMPFVVKLLLSPFNSIPMRSRNIPCSSATWCTVIDSRPLPLLEVNPGKDPLDSRHQKLTHKLSFRQGKIAHRIMKRSYNLRKTDNLIIHKKNQNEKILFLLWVSRKLQYLMILNW